MGMVLFIVLDDLIILKVNIWYEIYEYVRKIVMKLIFFGCVINFWKIWRFRLNILDLNDNGKCDMFKVRKVFNSLIVIGLLFMLDV